MRVIVPFLSGLVIAMTVLVMPARAQVDSPMAMELNQNLDLPPGYAMSFSLSNMRMQRGGTPQPARCERLEGVVQFFGTVDTTADGTPTFVAPGDSAENQKRVLLDTVDFSLAPGEVHRFDFQQPFGSTSNVLVAAAVPPQSRHCLASSSATVRSPGGSFAIVAPAASGIVRRPDIIILDEPIGVCCPCAPVCACGLCDP